MGRNKALSYADNPSVENVARRASIESATSNASWYPSENQDPQPGASKVVASTDLEAYLDGFLAARNQPKGPLPAFKKTGSNGEYAQALMDYMYNAVEVPREIQEGQTIVVYVQERAGLGDIYFGAKIANMLKRALRHCNVHCVIGLASPGAVVPDTLEGEYFSAPAGGSGAFTVEALGMNDTWQTRPGGPTVVVSGPAGDLKDIGQLNLGKGTPVILAPEYGMRAQHVTPPYPPEWRVAPSGAAEDEYGLVLEPNFLSGTKLDLGTYNPALAAKVKPGEYYFAYVNGYNKIKNELEQNVENNSHKHVLNFIGRYKQESNKSNKPNKVVFAGRKTQKDLLQAALKESFWFEDLSGGGSKKTVPEGKELYVYFQAMNHAQFLSALQNSHKIRFVTGDQSLSETLSLDEFFIIYEALAHKAKSFGDIVNHCGLGLFSLRLTENTPGMQFMVDFGLDRFEKEKTQVMSRIRNERNFRHRIVGAVKSHVLREGVQKIAALDDTISELARQGGAASAILDQLEKLGQELQKV